MVERVVEKEVVKYIEAGGKPTRLAIAYEWLNGMNREYNPTLALEIFHEEADRANSPAACNSLGQIY